MCTARAWAWMFDASGAVCRWAAVAGMLSERLEMMPLSYQW